MQQAQAIQKAWLDGTPAAADAPRTAALLSHPALASLSARFAGAAACLLRRAGASAAAAAAEAAAALDAPRHVLAWPSALSYAAEELMPTGRDAALPGAAARGLYVARAAEAIIVRVYDPRLPLEAQEVQDAVPDMYSLEIRAGELFVFPPWLKVAVLLQPQGRAAETSQPPPRGRPALRESGSTEGAGRQPPPQRPSADAVLINLALPGEPAASAASILPIDMPLRSGGEGGFGHGRLEGGRLEGEQAHGGGAIDAEAAGAGARDEEGARGGGSGAARDAAGLSERLRSLDVLAGSGAAGRGSCSPGAGQEWWAYGSPVTVFDIQQIRPGVDIPRLQALASDAFAAFRSCFPDRGARLDRERPGGLDDALYRWQSAWLEAHAVATGGADDAGAVRGGSEAARAAWSRLYGRYVRSEAYAEMLAAVEGAVTDLMRGVGKGTLVATPPRVYSWITVHDTSTSFHGRHYHRSQAMTAVLYLEVTQHSAPLELANPLTGAAAGPNGAATFLPRRGDVLLFPSYLPHTVPMRHASRAAGPRVSIAFNIVFRGAALERFSGPVAADVRDGAGPHQYVAASDIVLDGASVPREGLAESG